MNNDEYDIENYISPCDVKLLDVVCANLDAIAIATRIFADRNSKEQTSAFVLGTLATVTEGLTGVNVPAIELMRLVNKYGGLNNDKE